MQNFGFFFLVVEVLSIKLIKNNKIKGIKINGFEYNIIQLADDTLIFLNDSNSLKLFISEFLQFEKISSLKLNLDKSEIIKLGSITLKQFDVPKQLDHIKN